MTHQVDTTGWTPEQINFIHGMVVKLPPPATIPYTRLSVIRGLIDTDAASLPTDAAILAAVQAFQADLAVKDAAAAAAQAERDAELGVNEVGTYTLAQG